MAQVSSPKSSWFAFGILIIVFLGMLSVFIRTTAEAAGPTILKDQDGCEYSLTKDPGQKFHLSGSIRKQSPNLKA